MFTRRLLLALTPIFYFLLLGCREAKIASYRVKKDAVPPPRVAATAKTAVPRLKWNIPPGWEEQPAGDVRFASFLITADGGRRAEMSVTQFPGTVGGDLANINRWRGQLQLAPITEAELPKFVRPIELPAGQFQFTEMASEAPVLQGKFRIQMLGAWSKKGDRTWFFKLAGETELVNAQRDAFQTFLRSIEFEPEAGADVAPVDVSTASSPAAPFSTPASHAVTWSAPASWTPKPLGQMRKGSFSLPGAGGSEADLSIISFPGDAGGIADNLNRWRGQVQLPPLDPAELASSAHTIANAGLRFTIVDYVGTTTTGPTRLIGAVLPFEKETYFFKLLGPEPVVAQHKDAFMDFLKTVKAP